jgi:arylsulfatase A-like enzyme
MSTATGLSNLMWAEYPDASPAVQEQMMACIVNEYSAEIRFLDDQVGRLWDEFDKRRLLDDTLVVFYADHGEQFNEHGRFQHTWSLYSEENASVAAFWAVGIAPKLWSEPTIHQDLAPTILDALGVPGGQFSGVVAGRASPDRPLITFNSMNGWGGTVMAVVQNDKKLMYWWAGGKRYYDLSLDSAEQVDVYDAADPTVLALWDVMRPAIDKATESWPELVPVDPVP